MKRNNRPMGVFKTDNEYQKTISRELYEKTPKAVFAAIVVSMYTNSGICSFDEIDKSILHEWDILNKQGIVPQKAPKIKSNDNAGSN